MPTPDPAGPAPDPKAVAQAKRLIADWWNDRSTGSDEERAAWPAIEAAKRAIAQLEADLTALRAERDDWQEHNRGMHAANEALHVQLAEARAELQWHKDRPLVVEFEAMREALAEARARLADVRDVAIPQADGVNRHLFVPSDSDEAICSVCGGWMIDPEHRGLAVPPQDQEQVGSKLGRLALPAWQAVRDLITQWQASAKGHRENAQRTLKSGNTVAFDRANASADMLEFVCEKLTESLPPPPAAEGEKAVEDDNWGGDDDK